MTGSGDPQGKKTYLFEELTIFTSFLVILRVKNHLWLKDLGWGGHGEGVRAWVPSGWGGRYSAASTESPELEERLRV